MVVFLVKPVSVGVYLGYVDVFIEIQYRFKSKFAFNLSYCINVNSQTNVKIDINYVIDNQNMQEHNNNKQLGSFVFESEILVN